MDGRPTGHAPCPAGRLGDVIPVSVRLTNSGRAALSDVTLTVGVYQDLETGATSRRLENKLAVAGATRRRQDEVGREAGRYSLCSTNDINCLGCNYAAHVCIMFYSYTLGTTCYLIIRYNYILVQSVTSYFCFC